MKTNPVLAVLLPVLVSCGGSSQSESSITGSVAGAPFPHGVAASFAVVGAAGFSVNLANRPELTCADLQSGARALYENSTLLELGVDTADASGGPIALKAYPIEVGGAASAYLLTSNATCTASSLQATSGTITVTHFDSSSVAGSYSVTFGQSGTLSGIFAGENCAFDASSSDADAGSKTCAP